MAKHPTRRRKLMNLHQQRTLLTRIVEIREHGQQLRAEHDQLMSQLIQTVAAGDVIDVAMPNGSCRRVTVIDPFLSEHGRTVTVAKSVTVERFTLHIEELPPCPNGTAQGEA